MVLCIYTDGLVYLGSVVALVGGGMGGGREGEGGGMYR